MNNEDEKPEVQPEAPESFPPEVLRLPAGVRQEYFEQRCLISHPRLLQALETTLQEICPPDEGAGTRRPEAMETALCERKPLAIIVDEAHHLAEAARGSRLQSQLNPLKHFENATGVSH